MATVDLCVLAEEQGDGERMRQAYSQHFNTVLVNSEANITDFSHARNILLDKSKADYVMFLDTDEALLEETLTEMKRMLVEKPSLCYRFPRVNKPDGSNFPDYQVRLFRRVDCVWMRPAHEIVVDLVTGKPADQVQCIDIVYPIIHFPGSLHKRLKRFYRNMAIILNRPDLFPKGEAFRELSFFTQELLARYEDQEARSHSS